MSDIGYVLAAAAARHLPGWMSAGLALLIADLHTWTHPARVRAVNLRLARVWRERGDRGAPPSARETTRAFARALRDFLAAGHAVRGRIPPVRLDDEGRQILHAARASGASTVLVSGHFGPWEVALRWLAREVGSVDALAAPHRLPAVERFFAATRAAYGVRTLSQGRPAAAALARLRAGGWIAALADRGPRRGGSQARRGGTEARRDSLVALDRTPLLLARRASAQILAGVAWRAPDGAIEVRFHPAFTLEPRWDGISLSQAIARLQGFFDAHVRAHPTQWFHWEAGPAGSSADSV